MYPSVDCYQAFDRPLLSAKNGKDTRTMSEDNVIALKKPESIIVDQITDILRQGARKLLAQALEAEIDHFMSQNGGLKDDRGRQRIVRNGYLPERTIQSGIGSVPVQAPRARDRHPHAPERICFSSAI